MIGGLVPRSGYHPGRAFRNLGFRIASPSLHFVISHSCADLQVSQQHRCHHAAARDRLLGIPRDGARAAASGQGELLGALEADQQDYYESLEESLKGGVTLVQVREKTAETGEFVEITRKTKALCDRYGVPVLVNDRVDVALAAGVAGVHIGQDDMDPATARRLLGDDAILGLSVSTKDEAEAATHLAGSVLDYVGIGAIWSTQSKDVSKKVMLGPAGAGEILDIIADSGLRSVAIGELLAHSTADLQAASAPATRPSCYTARPRL